MPAIETDDLPVRVITAGMVVGTIALMILGVQPVLLGGLAEAHRVSDRGLGPLATAEVLMIALGSAVGPAFVRGGRMRLKIAVVSLLLVLANLAIVFADGWWALAGLRGLAGVLEGLLMGATILVTIQSRHPDQLNAIFLAVSALPQALMSWLLPIWIVPRLGPMGGFYILAALSGASVVAAVFLVDTVAVPTQEPHPRALLRRPVMLAIAAIGLQNAAIGGAWDYVERLADQHHFPTWAVGIAVSGGLIVQVIGAFLAGVFGRLAPFRGALLAGSLCQAAVILLMALSQTPLAYVAPALGFGLLWLAMSPFQVRLLIDIDPSRAAAEMLTAVSLVGLSIGPSVAALGVTGANVVGAFWVSTAMMLAASAIYLLA